MKKSPKEISWEANSFYRYKRSINWYAGLIVLTAVLAIIFLLLHNYLLAVIIAVAAVVTAKLAGANPTREEVAISDKGVTIRNNFYPFAFFKSYYLDNSYGVNRLYLETTRRIFPTMVVFLGSQDPLKINDLLARHLPPKINRFEVLNHKLLHWLKL